MAKIYTKTGDKGLTRLVDGSCVEKFNPRVEAYGTLDELNSSLGVVRSVLIDDPTFRNYREWPRDYLDQTLFKIQNHLFILGSLLATADNETFNKLNQIQVSHIEFLEKEIDRLTIELAPLRNFILPAGHQVTAFLHLSRSLCRRAERRCAEIAIPDERYAPGLIYLNRLSDYLFTAARWVQFQLKLPEVLWDASL